MRKHRPALWRLVLVVAAVPVVYRITGNLTAAVLAAVLMLTDND